VYPLMPSTTSLMHTSEIKLLLNSPLIILVFIFFNAKTLTMLMLFLVQASSDLVSAGTTLVTPGILHPTESPILG